MQLIAIVLESTVTMSSSRSPKKRKTAGTREQEDHLMTSEFRLQASKHATVCWSSELFVVQLTKGEK